MSGAQGLLGIVPEYDGLRIDPCVPRSWKSFRVTRRFRDTVYEIEVRNPGGAGHGVRSLTVDGRELEGNVVPPQEGPGPVRVEVVLGYEPVDATTSESRPCARQTTVSAAP